MYELLDGLKGVEAERLLDSDPEIGFELGKNGEVYEGQRICWNKVFHANVQRFER
jgi:hypothetical protein